MGALELPEQRGGAAVAAPYRNLPQRMCGDLVRAIACSAVRANTSLAAEH